MSGIGKDLLIFDATDADATDNVGAYLRASDGTLLTHTDISGKKALDVNVANSIAVDVDLDFATDTVDASGSVVGVSGDVNVTQGTSPWVVSATDLDIRDLTQTDEITVFQGTSPWIISATDLDIRDLSFATDSIDVSGSAVSVTGSVTVTASDLDIRDLSFATDKVDVSGSEVSLDAATLAALETITVEQGTSPWVVSATDLDIRDLSSATDSVTAVGDIADDAADSGNPVKVGSRAASGPLAAISAAGDRADMISDLYRRLYINDSANIGIASKTTSVADSAVNLVASALAGRRRMVIENLDNKPIYLGPASVTTASGLRISGSSSLSLEIGPDVDVYAISADANAKDVRIFELA